MDVASDVGILRGNGVLRVQHDNGNICPVNRSQCPDNAEGLHSGLNVAPPSNPRRVDQPERPAGVFQLGVDRIPGGPRKGIHHRARLAGYGVQERALAHIWPADDGHRYVVLVVLSGRQDLRGEGLKDRIEQIPRAAAANGRDDDGGFEAKLVELGSVCPITRAITFVCDQQHRLVCAAKALRYIEVRPNGAITKVGEKQNEVCFLDCQGGLGGHGFIQGSSTFEAQTASVDQRERGIAPVDIAIDTVAGSSRNPVNYRLRGADQAIKQRGLTHVGASHDRDDRAGHETTLSGVGCWAG